MYRTGSKSVLDSKCSLGNPASRIASTHLGDIVIRDAGIRRFISALYPLRMPSLPCIIATSVTITSLSHHVVNIVRQGSEEQMVRTYARWIVTMMKHL
jgi:hypothetical protein